MDTNIGSSLFQGTSVNIDNAGQNLEEEEDLEDIKRRQEEIQSLLTKAMDDFNYDDQSTVNTSVNESAEFAQQYKEADIDNQLQVLYNIRVKEVESLQEKMRAMEQELVDTKAQMMQRLMLSEAENDKLRTSFKHSQELLVDTCNEIEQLKNDNQRVLVDIESYKQVMTKLEVEKAAVDYNNKELREQVAILEDGRATNPLNEAMIQENHRMEVTKLQHNLDAAYTKNARLEKENFTLAEQLNSAITEKTNILANKTDAINKLVQNLDQAQEHNTELVTNVSRLSMENEKLRVQVQDLESNVQVLKGFTDKAEIIKILQKELEKSKQLIVKQTTEFEKLQHEYSDLLRDNKAQKVQVLLLEENLAQLERKPMTETQSMQTSMNIENVSVASRLREELDSYKVQCHKQNEILETLQNENTLLQQDVSNLHKKLELSAERDNLTAALQVKAIRLEEIIRNNQKPPCETRSTNTDPLPVRTEPASPIELAKTKDESPEAILKVYKTHFETQLIEKEIELRKQLQAEFEKQYVINKQTPTACTECSQLAKDIKDNEKLIQDLKGQLVDNAKMKQKDIDNRVCRMCHEMSTNLMQNMEIISKQENELEHHRINQEKDKVAIVQMLEEWKSRFEDMEQQNFELQQQADKLTAALKRAKEDLIFYQRSEEELMQLVQRKARNVVSNWASDTMEQVRLHNHQIRATRTKIESICRLTENRVKEIERNFDQAHVQLKHSASTLSKKSTSLQ